MATAERYLDRATGEWVDRETVWLDVVCWKALADHVVASIHKGDPVLVRGRLRVSTWESEQGPRQSIQVVATSVGHDLSRGRATFTRHRRAEPEPAPEVA
jgi:single-strand DNA-binding protein